MNNSDDKRRDATLVQDVLSSLRADLRDLEGRSGDIAEGARHRVSAAGSDTEFDSILERATIADGAGRFAAWVHPVAQHVDLPLSDAATLLSGIDDASVWEASPFDGVELFHVTGGPEVSEAIVGFVRVGEGGEFPEHEHIGRELCFVVEGELRIGDAERVYQPGELVLSDAATSHGAMVNAGDGPLVYLAVVFEGVRVSGMELLPGDPRI